jgi:hypothetical protein
MELVEPEANCNKKLITNIQKLTETSGGIQTNYSTYAQPVYKNHGVSRAGS